MGRIREALRQADLKRKDFGQPVVVPHAYQPEEEAVLEHEAAEEVPFIEVGGRQTPVDASPSVLAATPARVAHPGDATTAIQPIPHPHPPEAPSIIPVRDLIFRPLPVAPPDPGPAAKRLAAELVAFHSPDDPLNERYRVALAGMAAQLPANQPQALLFTSLSPTTPTSDLLLNLAIIRARAGRRIIAVDAHLEQPVLSIRLGLPAAPGLGDVLAGTLSLQRAARPTGLDNLFVLTAGTGGGDGHLLLAGEAMRALLRHLRTRYDWILVDAPCWDGRPEVVALGSACDAVYVVLPQAEAETPQTEDLLEFIPQQGSRLRGCFLTTP